jgi:hypothetical protein
MIFWVVALCRLVDSGTYRRVYGHKSPDEHIIIIITTTTTTTPKTSSLIKSGVISVVIPMRRARFSSAVRFPVL